MNFTLPSLLSPCTDAPENRSAAITLACFAALLLAGGLHVQKCAGGAPKR